MCIIPLFKMSNVHGDWGGAVKRLDILHLVQTMLEPVGWLVVLGFNCPFRQYFSLYQAVSQREGERGEKG